MHRLRIVLIIFFCLAILSSPAAAGSGDTLFTNQLITLTADASAVALDSAFIGSAIYALYVFSTADTSVTISIDLPIGASGTVPLFPATAIDATSGYKYRFPTAWPLSRLPTYTVSGIGSGTVWIVPVGGNK